MPKRTFGTRRSQLWTKDLEEFWMGANALWVSDAHPLSFVCISLSLWVSLSLSYLWICSLSSLILATDDELTIQFENSGDKVFFLLSAQHLRNENYFHLKKDPRLYIVYFVLRFYSREILAVFSENLYCFY